MAFWRNLVSSYVEMLEYRDCEGVANPLRRSIVMCGPRTTPRRRAERRGSSRGTFWNLKVRKSRSYLSRNYSEIPSSYHRLPFELYENLASREVFSNHHEILMRSRSVPTQVFSPAASRSSVPSVLSGCNLAMASSEKNCLTSSNTPRQLRKLANSVQN